METANGQCEFAQVAFRSAKVRPFAERKATPGASLSAVPKCTFVSITIRRKKASSGSQDSQDTEPERERDGIQRDLFPT